MQTVREKNKTKHSRLWKKEGPRIFVRERKKT